MKGLIGRRVIYRYPVQRDGDLTGKGQIADVQFAATRLYSFLVLDDTGFLCSVNEHEIQLVK